MFPGPQIQREPTAVRVNQALLPGGAKMAGSGLSDRADVKSGHFASKQGVPSILVLMRCENKE